MANAMSAKSCGCDPGANWTCRVHQEDPVAATIACHLPEESYVPVYPKKLGVLTDEGYVPINPLESHLNDCVDLTWNAAGKCKNFQDHALNAAMGLAGEAGEVLDVHKKMFFHKDKDYKEDILEELGDVCYYLAKVLQLHGISLEEALAYNKTKLFRRYEVRK